MSLPHSPPEAPALALPPQCGTLAAVALHPALLAAAAAEPAPVVDAGAVESVGQAMLQLLLAARAARPDLRIVPASAPFVERVAACGLAAAFDLRPVEG